MTQEMSTHWLDLVDLPFTACDAEGIICYMNEASIRLLDAYGGKKFLGKNLMDCHPPKAREAIKEMYKSGVTKTSIKEDEEGKRTLVYRVPWGKDGEIQGLLEISLPLPESLFNPQR